MAPTPTETSEPQPSSTAVDGAPKTWTTASIVGVSIFGAFVLIFAITLTAFLFHRRRELKKLPPSHRPTSYHPFRTNSAKDGLLAHAAPAPSQDRKSSMFSNERHSSVSLYVEHDSDPRASIETSSLIPLHVSPVEDTRDHDSMDTATMSMGSGVSRGSSRFSTTSSAGSLGLSSIPIPGQEQYAPNRPASTRRMSSATSSRYYDINTNVAPPVPQIPKIVHSGSP